MGESFKPSIRSTNSTRSGISLGLSGSGSHHHISIPSWPEHQSVLVGGNGQGPSHNPPGSLLWNLNGITTLTQKCSQRFVVCLQIEMLAIDSKYISKGLFLNFGITPFSVQERMRSKCNRLLCPIRHAGWQYWANTIHRCITCQDQLELRIIVHQHFRWYKELLFEASNTFFSWAVYLQGYFLSQQVVEEG